MPHDPLFDSAWHKWAWAVLQAVTLEGEIAAFANNLGTNPILTVRTDYQPKRHAFAVIITSLTPTPAHWGLRLGDIAHNFRSALDHVAWAITIRGTTQPDTLPERRGRGIQGPVQTDIGFPIRDTDGAFTKAVVTALPGALSADIAIVRRYQPYARDRRRKGTQCLTILSSLNNFDKHRELQPVFSWPTGVRYEVIERRNCVVTDKRPRGHACALEVGAELGTIRVRRTGPDPYLEVKPDVTAQVTLRETRLVEWFANTEAWTEALLSEFSDCPVHLPTVRAGFDAFDASMKNP